MDLEVSPLFALAVIVAAGVAGGALAGRLKAPHVAGQILVGVLIGHAGISLFAADTVDGLSVITEFALGVIAVSIGDHLNIRRMRNSGRRLFLLLLTEATLTPLLVFGAVSMVAALLVHFLVEKPGLLLKDRL